ncbi:MAG: hypothetical protein L3J69_05960 [Desulfobacula sp.]|nr:hypothetical protein [Desulfobacula sp.]
MFFLTWLALCFIAALIASGRGRSGVGFFFLAFFLSPLVGILAAIFVKENAIKIKENLAAAVEKESCSFCGEPMKDVQLFCRFCGENRPN